MSTELWAIIGVVVGALATGSIGFLQTMLQRRWSAEDAERAWDREKRDRLFEAKRSAHEAFTEAAFSVRLATLPGDLAKFGDIASHLMNLQARLKAYASKEAADAASVVVSKILGLSIAQSKTQEVTREQITALVQAQSTYVELMRIDLGRDDGTYTLDQLKAWLDESLKSTEVDPDESS